MHKYQFEDQLIIQIGLVWIRCFSKASFLKKILTVGNNKLLSDRLSNSIVLTCNCQISDYHVECMTRDPGETLG